MPHHTTSAAPTSQVLSTRPHMVAAAAVASCWYTMERASEENTPYTGEGQAAPPPLPPPSPLPLLPYAAPPSLGPREGGMGASVLVRAAVAAAAAAAAGPVHALDSSGCGMPCSAMSVCRPGGGGRAVGRLARVSRRALVLVF